MTVVSLIPSHPVGDINSIVCLYFFIVVVLLEETGWWVVNVQWCFDV